MGFLLFNIFLIFSFVFHFASSGQMTAYDVAKQNGTFRSDIRFILDDVKKRIVEGPFEVMGHNFPFTKYPIQAKVRIEEKADNNVYVSLFLQGPNDGEVLRKRTIPQVYYLLRDRSTNNVTKNICVSYSYPFNSMVNNSVSFEQKIGAKGLFTDPLYNADDTVVIDVFVEPPSMAGQVLTFDGTLIWGIDNYAERKMMAQNNLVAFSESFYFYTRPGGYRVRVNMWLDGFEGSKGKIVSAQIRFLNGKFDDKLPHKFHHKTTFTLINKIDPSKNIVIKTEKGAEQVEDYFIEVCDINHINSFIEADTLFYSVSIIEIV